jgi:hypothetical protein
MQFEWSKDKVATYPSNDQTLQYQFHCGIREKDALRVQSYQTVNEDLYNVKTYYVQSVAGMGTRKIPW